MNRGSPAGGGLIGGPGGATSLSLLVTTGSDSCAVRAAGGGLESPGAATETEGTEEDIDAV